MKSLFLIPLLLLVTIAPLMAYSQTAGSGGSNTPFVPAEEFNPILTPIDPTPLNSNSTFFDDWCETNESGNNVDAGTWICWYDIEQMYDDIIVLWNDEATVLQVEVDDLNDTVSDMQLELDRLKELTIPDHTKPPTIYHIEEEYNPSSNSERFTAYITVQAHYDHGTGYSDKMDTGSKVDCKKNNESGTQQGHQLSIFHELGLRTYKLQCLWSSDSYDTKYFLSFRGDLEGTPNFIFTKP